MKRAVSFLIALIIAIVYIQPVYALDEPTIAIAASQETFGIGDTIYVSIYVTSPEKIQRLTSSVTYDTSKITFVSGNGATGSDGTVWIDLSADSQTAQVNLTFTAAAAGETAVNVESCYITDNGGTQKSVGTASSGFAIVQQTQTQTTVQTQQTTTTSATETTQETSTTTQSKQTKKGEAPSQGVLIDLKTDKGTLIPPFMYSIHEYTLTVPYEVDKVEIDGTTASESDRIWYTGNPECVVGKNIRTIKVTDITGKETVYTITITRLDKEEANTQTSASQKTGQSGHTTEAKTKAVSAVTHRQGIDLKDKLMPALYIALIVLVVSLVIVIIWIKNKLKGQKEKDEDGEKKTKKQRSKIKVTATKEKKKK